MVTEEEFGDIHLSNGQDSRRLNEQNVKRYLKIMRIYCTVDVLKSNVRISLEVLLNVTVDDLDKLVPGGVGSGIDVPDVRARSDPDLSSS